MSKRSLAELVKLRNTSAWNYKVSVLSDEGEGKGKGLSAMFEVGI